MSQHRCVLMSSWYFCDTFPSQEISSRQDIDIFFKACEVPQKIAILILNCDLRKAEENPLFSAVECGVAPEHILALKGPAPV